MRKIKLFFPILLLIAAAFVGALIACSGGKEPEGPPTYGPGEVDPDVVSITLDTTNATTVYDIGGDPFDPSGVGLVLHYADGSTKLALSTADQVIAPDLTSRGSKTVTVKYGELTATFDVLVREIESLSIDAATATRSFELNSDFSVGGLKVYAKFFDIEETERIKDGKYELSGYDMSKRGDQSVTVKYLGKQESYNVRVTSKPVELKSAVLEESGGSLYLTVKGSVLPEAKYTKNELALDVQKLNTDDYISLVWSDASVGVDGEFEVKGKLDSYPENDKPYLVHVILGGDSYDVASLAESADNMVAGNGRFYRLKSEKAFDNNETLFAVLRNSADIKTLASYEVTGVSVVEDGGKAYLEVTGTHGNYTQEQIGLLQFYFDVQGNREAMNDGSNDGNRYLEQHNVALDLGENATFSVRFDLTALGVYKYTVHFRSGDAMNNDSDNLICKGKDNFIDINGKRYKLVFGDPVYWGAVGLEVYDCSDPDGVYMLSLDTSRTQKQFYIGSEFSADGLVVTATTYGGETRVIEAGDDGYTLVSPDISTVGVKTVSVAYGGITATYTVEVIADPSAVVGLVIDGAKTDFELGDAFSAGDIKVYKLMGDGKRVEIKAGDYTLTAPTADDMRTPGKKTVAVTAEGGLSTTYTVTVWSKPAINGATIADRGGKLMLEISGVIAGYADPIVTVDLQKLYVDEYIRDLVCTPTVDPDTGAFTASVEIGALGLGLNTSAANVGYMIHVIVNGDPYDLVDILNPSDATVEFGGKHYRLRSECCFPDNVSKFVILRAAASASELSPNVLYFHSVTMAENSGNVAVTVTGYFEGISNISDLKLQWRSKNSWDQPIEVATTVNTDGSAFTATVTIPNDDTKVKAGEEVLLWAKLDGVIDSELSNRNIAKNAVTFTRLETNNGRYTLEQKSLFDEKKLITVLLEKECKVTSATLTEEGGKVYLVLGGTVEGAGNNWSPTVDLQYTSDNWGTTVVTPSPSVVLGADGAFTVKQELTEFAFNSSYVYISHLNSFGQSHDAKDLDGFVTSSVEFGGKTYKLEARDLFNNGSFYICLTVA